MILRKTIHILNECNKYKNNNTITHDISELFGDNIQKINNISKEITNTIDARKSLIKNEN